MTPRTLLDYLVSVLTQAASNLTPQETQEEDNVGAAIKAWLSSESRVITAASFASAEKFIQAELDYVTPGDRGLGRLSDFEPRFAAKHRSFFQKLDESALSAIRCEFLSMIFAGYLFLEYMNEVMTEEPFTRHPETAKNSASLFSQWIPMIYSPQGSRVFDEMMKEGIGESAYRNIKSFWYYALLEPTVRCFDRLNIALNDKDKIILLSYFDSGIVLRQLEQGSLTQDEMLDIATGGGYSADKAGVQQPANRSGCAVLLLAGLIIVGSIFL